MTMALIILTKDQALAFLADPTRNPLTHHKIKPANALYHKLMIAAQLHNVPEPQVEHLDIPDARDQPQVSVQIPPAHTGGGNRRRRLILTVIGVVVAITKAMKCQSRHHHIPTTPPLII